MDKEQILRFINKNMNKIYMVCYMLFILYSCLMIWEVFIGPYRSYSSMIRYNIYPLRTITDFILNNSKYSSKVVFINLSANIITFIPLGLFIPLLFKRFSKFLNLLMSSILIITIIEIGQFVLNVGVFDIDDIILNTIGSMLGFMIYKIGKGFLT